MAADFDKKRDRKNARAWPEKLPGRRIQAKAQSDASARTPLFLQRSPASPTSQVNDAAVPAPAPAATAEPEANAADLNNSPVGILIVEDSVAALGPGQMRKSEFLAQLRAEVCATAEDALAGTVWSAVGCPWIDHWFSYYSDRDGQQVERAVRKYAPETAGISSAKDLIPVICRRVRGAIAEWRVTGEMTQDVPAGLPTAGGGEGGDSPAATSGVSMKAREGSAGESHSAGAVQGQLGSGRPLDGGVRSHLESAYGEDFSRVRVHTDANAASVSSSLEARAFTVGDDIAFGANEYRPGTPVGDALIAHELAHVKQQRGEGASEAAAQKGATEYGVLEEDADQAAVGAVVSIWGGAKNGLAGVARNTMPSLRSGLRLQRCGKKTEPQKKEGKLLEDFAAKFPDAADMIRKSESAMKLVKEAEVAGAKFGGYSEDQPDKDDWPYTLNGRVYIPKSHTDKILAMRSFLFELNNAIRDPIYAELAREAAKGSAGTLTAKEFARRIVEQEVEGMLRLGGVWFEMKKELGGGKELDKYDEEFYLSQYKDYTAGKKTKDDIVKEVLRWVYPGGNDKGKTIEQAYMDKYNEQSKGK
ncbi:MAG TPA: DUF4157 domain-containing protein [Blastocatellia bacterium]|nr:DUF4157 domain-containing protein [Blastocatellia bacterium]